VLGIEGFYLLRDLPDTAADIIPPMEFPDNSVVNIRACLDCVNATYTNAPNIRAEWDSWAQKYCPRSNSSLEYLEYLRSVQLPYHIPLKAILLHRRNVIEFPAWRDRPLERAPLNHSTILDWPEVLSAATHSVRTSMNMMPYENRIFCPSDEQLVVEINTYMNNVGPLYYDGILRGSLTTKDQLIKMIGRKVGYSGEIPSRAGTILYYYNGSLTF